MVDVLRGNAGAIKCRRDGVTAKIRGGQVLQAAKQLADRRTRTAHDH